MAENRLYDIFPDSHLALSLFQKKLANLAFVAMYRGKNLDAAVLWVDLHILVTGAYNNASEFYPGGWNRVGRDSYILTAIEKAINSKYGKEKLNLIELMEEGLEQLPPRMNAISQEFAEALLDDLIELPHDRRDFVVVWADTVQLVEDSGEQSEDVAADVERYFQGLFEYNSNNADDILLMKFIRARVLYAIYDLRMQERDLYKKTYEEEAHEEGQRVGASLDGLPGSLILWYVFQNSGPKPPLIN
jgi:hypothetical protein